MKKPTARTETMPFPCVILDSAGKIRDYNRLAGERFPFLRRGMCGEKLGLSRDLRGLTVARILREEAQVFSVEIGPEEDRSLLFAFLDDPAFPWRSLIRETLRDADYSYRKFEAALRGYLEKEDRSEENTERLKKLFGEDRVNRRRQVIALQLLDAGREEAETKRAVSPGRFLNHLSDQLAASGKGILLRKEEVCAAAIPVRAFGCIVLDLVSFAEFFGSGGVLPCEVVRRAGQVRIRFFFEDAGDFMDLFRSFLEENDENAALFLPLLSAMTLCRHEEIRFRFFCEGKGAVAQITLPAVPAVPELFLGAKEDFLRAAAGDLCSLFYLR